ncbi:hypothetical protein BC828DRAFT_405166 [Blastocladiella britannica]|nr:hypothetical protein BC828DRAFT_405166 [Blastocladiella britannica]
MQLSPLASFLAVLVALVAVMVPSSLANPDGSPVCSVDVAAMAKNHGGAQNSTLGFFFDITVLTNTTFAVSVKTKVPTVANYRGLLLWANSARGIRTGTWKLPPNSKGFKTVCGGMSVTQDRPGLRMLASVDPASPVNFVLTVPADAPQPISFSGAIIGELGLKQWNVISSTPAPAYNKTEAASMFQQLGGASAALGSGAASTSASVFIGLVAAIAAAVFV